MDDVKRLIRRTARRLKNGEGEPDFFELVRRIENVYTNMPRVGSAHNPRQEPVRFGQTPHLRFPETSVSEVDTSADNADLALIYVYFFGLLGANGPMPLEFTNYVFQRSQNYYDMTIRRFLDIIHHRMLSLFYRSWASCEQAVSFDRADDDLIGDVVASLAGHFKGSVNGALPDYSAHGFSRFMVREHKSRDELEQMLSSFFGTAVNIIERVAYAHDIPKKYRCVLGNADTAVLGRNAQLGGRYFSCCKKFVVEVGPLPLELCKKMLPGTDSFEQLTGLINMYLDRPLEYDVTFLLSGDTVPQCMLDGQSALGRKAWLASEACREPELVLNIGASRMSTKHHMQSYVKA